MKTVEAKEPSRRPKKVRANVIPFQTTSSARRSSMSTRTRAKLWDRSYGDLLKACDSLRQKIETKLSKNSEESSAASPRPVNGHSPSSDVSESVAQ